ncbi:hypothetical protein [Halalkalicoccus salilacus]|uniref:hypothetical protein n=1 Tax=Halalkalicoccus TaxID=332246 RepID=UPI002F965F7B
MLDDGAVAVTFTLGNGPESTIELEYWNVTDYVLYFGPYTPGTHAPRTVVWRMVHEAVERYDLFPNGQYEIETIDEKHSVRFEANLLFSRHRDSRPVEAVIGDIETLLGHCRMDRL